jgi:prevent-host-death family protein
MRVGLREANQHFAKVIRAVRRGREVVLTDRGKPVAVVKPVRENEEDRLRRLAAEGVLTPAVRSEPMGWPSQPAVPAGGESIATAVSRDRDETA